MLIADLWKFILVFIQIEKKLNPSPSSIKDYAIIYFCTNFTSLEEVGLFIWCDRSSHSIIILKIFSISMSSARSLLCGFLAVAFLSTSSSGSFVSSDKLINWKFKYIMHWKNIGVWLMNKPENIQSKWKNIWPINDTLRWIEMSVEKKI